MKVGDSTTVAFKFQTTAGAAVTYANLAAFTGAGWAIEALILGSSVTLTVASLVPDPATSALSSYDGTHLVTFTVPAAGLMLLRPYNASTSLMSAYDLALEATIADADSLAAQMNAGLGTLIAGGSVSTVNDVTAVEGDSLQATFTVPTSALKLLSGSAIVSFSTLADISATAWTIAAQARYTTENGELPSNPVAFSLTAAIIDKVNNVVAIGWPTAPAGAIIDDLLPSVPTVTVSGGAITGATGGTGGHIYTGRTVTVTLTGGGGTLGALTATVDTNGRITGYIVAAAGSGYGSAPTATLSVNSDGSVASRTFAYDIQLVPPSGSAYGAYKLTVIRGNLPLLRQQTTTP